MDIGKQQRVIMVTPLETSEWLWVTSDLVPGEDAPPAEAVRERPTSRTRRHRPARMIVGEHTAT